MSNRIGDASGPQQTTAPPATLPDVQTQPSTAEAPRGFPAAGIETTYERAEQNIFRQVATRTAATVRQGTGEPSIDQLFARLEAAFEAEIAKIPEGEGREKKIEEMKAKLEKLVDHIISKMVV